MRSGPLTSGRRHDFYCSVRFDHEHLDAQRLSSNFNLTEVGPERGCVRKCESHSVAVALCVEAGSCVEAMCHLMAHLRRIEASLEPFTAFAGAGFAFRFDRRLPSPARVLCDNVDAFVCRGAAADDTVAQSLGPSRWRRLGASEVRTSDERIKLSCRCSAGKYTRLSKSDARVASVELADEVAGAHCNSTRGTAGLQ